ncbi:unnamed protein product [Amaranthus hypochondriacus]
MSVADCATNSLFAQDNHKVISGGIAESNSWTNLYTMSNYELVDPRRDIEDSCKPKCAKSLHTYQVCAKRIESDETGVKHCIGQYFDYWQCLDHCVAPKLFGKLK